MGGEKAEASNKPGSVWDNHSSGTIVTDCLKQPTRESARDRQCETSSRTPLFGLAPGGVYRAANCYQSRGALLPHLFTLTDQGRRYIFCGTFHGLTPPRRYLAPCPKEPGLSSMTTSVTAIAWLTPTFSPRILRYSARPDRKISRLRDHDRRRHASRIDRELEWRSSHT